MCCMHACMPAAGVQSLLWESQSLGREDPKEHARPTFLACSSHSRRRMSARSASTCGSSQPRRRPACSASRIFFSGARALAQPPAQASHSRALPSSLGSRRGRTA